MKRLWNQGRKARARRVSARPRVLMLIVRFTPAGPPLNQGKDPKWGKRAHVQESGRRCAREGVTEGAQAPH